MLESKEIQYLKYLKNYSDHGIKIETDIPKNLQSLYLKINRMNFLVSCDANSWARIKISKEVNFMSFTQLFCVILHSW